MYMRNERFEKVCLRMIGTRAKSREPARDRNSDDMALTARIFESLHCYLLGWRKDGQRLLDSVAAAASTHFTVHTEFGLCSRCASKGQIEHQTNAVVATTKK